MAKTAREPLPLIRLGLQVKDLVTGFEGIAMGKAEYYTGCEQVLITPTTRKTDGDLLEGRWFDIDRIVVTGEGCQLPTRTSDGADKPAPLK